MSVRIINADVFAGLRQLEAESVHCVVTSPPYYGLRAYGIEPSVWGGDPDCEHVWGDKVKSHKQSGGTNSSTLGAWSGGHQLRSIERQMHDGNQSAVCRCGAWRGELGLEPSYPLYVENMVSVFRELRRVLRKDGTVWLNLGDSWQSGSRGKSQCDGVRHNGSPLQSSNAASGGDSRPNRLPQPRLKDKDLMGMPWRVAFALQDDGWWLRDCIVWAKSNPMPSSVTDRTTPAHEYLFLLSRSARYFYDHDAIMEPGVMKPQNRFTDGRGPKSDGYAPHRRATGMTECTERNKRSVWTIATEPYPDAHFATMPTALVEPCVMAGSSERGCCSSCGAPLVRKVKTTNVEGHKSNREILDERQAYESKANGYHAQLQASGKGGWSAGVASVSDIFSNTVGKTRETVGWSPSCMCKAGTVPATILDPFGGSGTVGLVADRLGRDAILIDASPDYCTMARNRIKGDAPLFSSVEEARA